MESQETATDALRHTALIEIKRFDPASKKGNIPPNMQRLLEAAAQDVNLAGDMRDHILTNLIGFYYDTLLVGFAIPRKERDRYYTTGPMYVMPQYRQIGIGKAFMKLFFSTRKGRVIVHSDNVAAVALLKSAGFRSKGNVAADAGREQEEYVKG